MNVSSKFGCLAAVGVLVAACGTAPSEQVATSAAARTTTSMTTTALPESTTTTAAATTTPFTPTTARSEPLANLPLPVEVVVSSERGIELLLRDGEVVRIWDQPTAIAFALGDGLLVGQPTSGFAAFPPWPDGSVFVIDSAGHRVLASESTEQIVLHDAGVVEGRPVAVAAVRTGYGPAESDERLLLIDLETEARSDLGSIGGWEAGARRIRLVGSQLVAALVEQGAEAGLLGVALDGTVVWELPALGHDVSLALAPAGDSLLLLDGGFEGSSFMPVASLVRLDGQTGAELGRDEIRLDLQSGIEIEGGFCQVLDWTGDMLLCEETYGGPLLIDPASGATSQLSGLDRGIPTAVRVGP